MNWKDESLLSLVTRISTIHTDRLAANLYADEELEQVATTRNFRVVPICLDFQ